MPEAIIHALPGARKAWFQLCLAACCLLSFSHLALARGPEHSRTTSRVQAQNSSLEFPDAQFAIGDFDGDRRPDLATVEIARFNSHHSRYWISFQLTKGRLQTIGITAPAGGLVLFARDVNGDRALDLVLVTAWRHELVAVLLNDGAGNFAAADPTQFQINSISSERQMGIVPRVPEDRTVLSFQYSALRGPGRKIPATRESEPAFSHAWHPAVTLFPSSVSGRAPPSSLLHV